MRENSTTETILCVEDEDFEMMLIRYVAPISDSILK